MPLVMTSRLLILSLERGLMVQFSTKILLTTSKQTKLSAAIPTSCSIYLTLESMTSKITLLHDLQDLTEKQSLIKLYNF